MRADMKQVLIERPRRGARFKHKRTNKPRIADWRGEDDYIERLPPRFQKSKSFDDLLGPLRKFLRAQVGRPWRIVYSEICANLDQRSITGKHLMQHLWQEIQVDCGLDENGRPDYPPHEHHPLRPFSGLYVHPRTGLVCWLPTQSKRARWKERSDQHSEETQGIRRLSDDTCLLHRRGIWYWVRFGVVMSAWDDRHNTYVPPVEFELPDRRQIAIQESRQLSAKELRQYGVSNSDPDNPVIPSVSRAVLMKVFARHQWATPQVWSARASRPHVWGVR